LPFGARASLSLSRNGALARFIVPQYQAESCNRRIRPPCLPPLYREDTGRWRTRTALGSVQCSAAIWEWDKPSFDCRSVVQYFVLATLDVLVSSQNSTSLGKVQSQLRYLFGGVSLNFSCSLVSCTKLGPIVDDAHCDPDMQVPTATYR
jgi:hypothetical protein